MKLQIKVGDLLGEQADVIICSANVSLNLSGGVGGALLLRGGLSIQRELHDYLAAAGKSWVPPGSVVRTSAGPLHAHHLLHAVAIEGDYRTNREFVAKTLAAALLQASRLGAHVVATAALATGFGKMPMNEFAEALRLVMQSDYAGIEELRVVLVRPDDAAEIARVLGLEVSSAP